MCVSKRNGVVLISVLAFIVLLMAVLMEFTYRSKVQLDVAHHRQVAFRTNQAAESALDIAKAFLSYAIDMNEPELDAFFEGGETLFLGEVEVEISLEPESTKYNLNRLVDGRGNLRRREVQVILRLADLLGEEYEESVLTYDMVMSVLEWITPEGTSEMLIDAVPGEPAGSEYYLGKFPPYVCKHNRLNTISELLLVRGITEDVLFGGQGGDEGADRPGLAEFLTLYGNSNGIRSLLQREGVTVEDLREAGPETYETFLTIFVTATLERTQRRIRAVVGKDGARVVELSREAR